MSRPTQLILVIAALALLLSPSSATAQESKPVRHTVVKGDTLELLAAEYYGSRSHAIYIMKRNGMTHPRPLKPREVLKIPVSRIITARRGDSFAGLAKQYLGDERRAEFLASYNNVDLENGLPAGQTLRIPFHVIHRTETERELDDISLSYFGDRSYTDDIKSYNFFESTTLPKGTKIVIPVLHVQSREAKPDKESQELVKKRADEQAVAKQRLREAGPKWRLGKYRDVIELLNTIDTDFLDAEQAIAVGVLLGGAYVATKDNATAKGKFEKALERRKSYKLKTFLYSPKILEVWKEAGGQVEAEPGE